MELNQQHTHTLIKAELIRSVQKKKKTSNKKPRQDGAGYLYTLNNKTK